MTKIPTRMLGSQMTQPNFPLLTLQAENDDDDLSKGCNQKQVVIQIRKQLKKELVM